VVRKLVQWLPLESLEFLVKLSVIDQLPLTIDDLKQSVSENEQWRFKAPTALPSAEERVHTGFFDNVNADNMGIIFAYLDM
jgi:hypothetical protein